MGAPSSKLALINDKNSKRSLRRELGVGRSYTRIIFFLFLKKYYSLRMVKIS